MKRNIVILVVAATGCGNLSNDDLIFLAGIPKAKEVALEVQDPSVSGALVGQQAELYAGASALAAGINLGVDGLLRFVDSLGRGYPPTERTADTRIWGPIRNVDHKGVTLRLEIERGQNDSGGTRFSFCLQATLDADYTGAAASCSDTAASGLHNILYGHYDPRNEGSGARSGSGEIFFDFDTLLAIGGNQGNQAGFFALTYDFTGGGDSKQIHIDWTGPASSPASLSYDYGRTSDGHVDFSFALSNINTGTTGNTPSSWSITAFWTEGQAGRGDALGTGGDLQPDQHATATECWDGGHRRTYWRAVVWDSTGAVVRELANEGNLAACPAG